MSSEQFDLTTAQGLEGYLKEVATIRHLFEDEEVNLQQKVSGGDAVAEKELFYRSLPLVVSLAKNIEEGFGLELPKALEAGHQALERAIKTYTPYNASKPAFWYLKSIRRGLMEAAILKLFPFIECLIERSQKEDDYDVFYGLRFLKDAVCESLMWVHTEDNTIKAVDEDERLQAVQHALVSALDMPNTFRTGKADFIQKAPYLQRLIDTSPEANLPKN